VRPAAERTKRSVRASRAFYDRDMDYRITGLAPDDFSHLFGLDDEALREFGARRYVVDESPGFPDRIELRDLAVGERALLLNYTHHAVATPYRSSHAIFVREGATKAYDRINTVPDVLRIRLLSLRSFDAAGMMLDADVIEGHDLEATIRRFFADPAAAYLHAHNAKRGCFAARIERA
jgi:hypothetical protein